MDLVKFKSFKGQLRSNNLAININQLIAYLALLSRNPLKSQVTDDRQTVR